MVLRGEPVTNATAPPTKGPISVFLSCSGTEKEFCVRLARTLSERGYEPVYDQSERVHDDADLRLTAQDEWWKQLKMMIASCAQGSKQR